MGAGSDSGVRERVEDRGSEKGSVRCFKERSGFNRVKRRLENGSEGRKLENGGIAEERGV